jgi:hypothetical protein
MTEANDMTLDGPGARLMRGAFALGVLALAALALSACAPSAERSARIAQNKAISEQLEALSLERVNTAAAMAVKHCPGIMSDEGIEPFLARMEAKAAEIGPRASPPARVDEGYLIDGELLEGAPTPGVAFRVRIYDQNADLRAHAQRQMTGVDLPDIKIAHQCGADFISSWGVISDMTPSQKAAVTLRDKMARGFAAAVGGQAETGGFLQEAGVVSGDERTSVHPYVVLEEFGPHPKIYHAETSPMQIGDNLVYVRQARVGVYFQSTPR